jgi:hypothetical protein
MRIEQKINWTYKNKRLIQLINLFDNDFRMRIYLSEFNKCFLVIIYL